MKDGMNDTEIYSPRLKYKIGDKVRITEQIDGLDYETKGLEGVIIDIDAEWSHPYEVKCEPKIDIELFKESELELIVETTPPADISLLRIAFIRDMDGKGGREKNISLIELENGLHRMNMRTSDIDDLCLYINNWQPAKLIFEIHDKQFRKTLTTISQKGKLGFVIKENGDVVYG